MEHPAGQHSQPGAAPVLLETRAQLVAFFNSLPDGGDAPRCAVDTEADSLHCFREKLCLIQFSAAERHVIIDPLKISDLSPLLEYLKTAEVWMHGADFDMSLFKRTFDFVPPVVLDTQTAARLCGFRQFGLAHLVQEIFQVSLSKQSQRANWARRPLPPAMVEYALNDVRYILPLADRLLASLREHQREAWFRQSCAAAREAVINRPPPDMEEAWRISGWGNLQPKGLAALRALWHWRNGEAERLDRPAFKIMNNEPMLEMARVFQEGGSPKLPDRFPPPPRRRFQAALDAVRAMPPEQWPKRRLAKRTPLRPDAERRLDVLKAHRDAVSAAMGIEGSLIASRAVLEEIAHDSSQAEKLVPWQRELMKEALDKLNELDAEGGR